MASVPRTEGAGVEVVQSGLTQKDKPMCPHGPTILFERFCNGNFKRFYACSSCRDRKVCDFYQNEEDTVSESTKRVRKEYIQRYNASLHSRADYSRLIKAHEEAPANRRYCRTCHMLLAPEEFPKHREHSLLMDVTDEQLNRPTSLLAPLENNKANAQYLFSKNTVDFISSTIDTLGFTHVLCIGAPRVHESLSKQRSMLLDIDSRFYQFYDKKSFAHYNMFNHHFFGGKKAEAEYRNFHRDAEPGRLLVVLDPPFGGLVDLIVHTLDIIAADMRAAHPTPGEENACPYLLWFFPYFMEQRMATKRDDLKMLDYKVDYANHESFREGPKGRKNGSPVRIFTNIRGDRVELPAEEGYKFCTDCEKYVSKENQHCKICKDCTSKDGKTYIHCDVCERCVKPSRVHCFKCSLCLMPGHDCGVKLGAGCHICGDFTHKKGDCPMKNNPPPRLSIKRKAKTEHVTVTKKKKTPVQPKKPKRKRPGQLYKKKKNKQKK